MITFQSLKKKHLPLLCRWLNTSHVNEWYGEQRSWTLEDVEKKYLPRFHNTTSKPIFCFIICQNEDPIGFIQYYNAYDYLRDQDLKIDALPSNLAALDFYIGESNALGRGLGSKILQQFLTSHIKPHYTACLVDPALHNSKAIHVYEKAGFKIIQSPLPHKYLWMMIKLT